MSDSHLGFQDLNKVDERGRNVIEERVYAGFEQTIKKIIDIKPDAVVHAGDIFHRDRPRIKPLYVFKQALENLIDADIPFIAINGNHDAPKSSARTSPFFIYEGSSGINIAHQNKYEFFEVGDYRFHCIPYCLDPNAYESEFSKIKLSGRDVLIMHGMVKSLCGEKLNTVGEYELNDKFLQSNFDYIALGHYHGRKRIAKNIWYSGSVEYFNFKETAQDKGILLVDLEKREVNPHNIYEIKYRLERISKNLIYRKFYILLSIYLTL